MDDDLQRWQYKDYDEYIQVQMQHHRTMYRTKNRELNRATDIVTVKESLPTAKKILCVGARDVSEVVDWRDAGFTAVGIDLFTTDEAVIEVIDAHKMDDRFGENEFDVVYASHSLEHMYDPEIVLRAVKRVGKFGAMVVLPLETVPTAKDPIIFDFIAKDHVDSEPVQQEFSELVGGDVRCLSVEKRPVESHPGGWIDLNRERPLEVVFLLTW